MINNETDISLIRKYLDGELDARAMHQLEQRAQDDPFLMDALEGYEIAGSDQQANIADLTARLNKRTGKNEAHVISWRFMSVAASVLLVLSVGGWLLFTPAHDVTEITKILPQKIKAPVAIPKTAQPLTTDKKSEIAQVAPQQLANSAGKLVVAPKTHVIRPVNQYSAATGFNPPLASADKSKLLDSVAKDTTPFNEMVVMGYAAKKKKDAPGLLADNKVKDVKINPMPTEQPLQARVKGVTTTVPLETQNAARQQIANNLIINGVVLGKNDGMPLPGATVRIKGSKETTQTDANGRFSLPAKTAQAATLQVGYIGYEATEVAASKKDSLSTIKLAPNNNSLAEVAVVNSPKPESGEDAAIVRAHPEGGWEALKKYLKEKAISPDGKKGTVKLSLMVSANGTVYDTRVIKSLSPDADQKAIDLLTQGPGWTASSTGKPEKITLKVHFEK